MRMVVAGDVIAYADKRGEVKQNKVAMDEARELGRVMVQIGRDNLTRGRP